MKTIIIEAIWPSPHLETAGEIALNLKERKKVFLSYGLDQTNFGMNGEFQNF